MRDTVILLDGWTFDFEREFVDRAFALFDKGFTALEVQETLKLNDKEILVIMLDWGWKRGKV